MIAKVRALATQLANKYLTKDDKSDKVSRIVLWTGHLHID